MTLVGADRGSFREKTFDTGCLIDSFEPNMTTLS